MVEGSKGFLLLAFSLLFISSAVWAQDTATIVGTVTDSSNAVIPAAKVTVANPDKGFTRQLASNAAGEYTAARIPIGTYVVTAEASGFEKSVRTGVTLSVGQTQRVDLQMTVGQMTQEVTVTGNLPKVETETAAISDVVTGGQIQNLQLNGRNFEQLVTLIPGAVADNGMDASRVGIGVSNMAIAVNGNRSTFNNWELDGGNFVDETSNGATGVNPNLDTIAEFRVSTSNYGADIGKHAGANIELVTKSGTKDFHGDAFEFVRNDTFDANSWFSNQQIAPAGGNAPKTPLKWNDYGYTIGGPFYIPGHYNTSKSKTFFFWSENWKTYREAHSTLTAGVPSARMRQGDFSECDFGSANYNSLIAGTDPANPRCVLPLNPATGLLYPGNQVPVDSNAKAMLDGLVPLPNNGVIGWVAANSLPTNWREEQIRVDQNINEKMNMFVRFTNDAWNQIQTGSLWSNGASYDSVDSRIVGPGKSAVVHITNSFRPTLLNEFIMSFEANHVIISPLTGGSSPINSIYRPSDFSVSRLFSQNTNQLLPGISVNGGLPFGFTMDTGWAPWGNFIHHMAFKDNIVWTRGTHSLKFGAYVQRIRAGSPWGQVDSQGYMNFSGGGWPGSTGNAMADMLVGRIQSYTEGSVASNGTPLGGEGWYRPQQWEWEGYAQDDWKVSRRLTLNLGVRYYYFQPWGDTSKPIMSSNFIPSQYDPTKEAQLDASGNLIAGSGHTYGTFGNGLVQCGTGGVPTACQNSTHGTLGPRFGFAYDPTGSGRTSIRGGYGLYYEHGTFNDTANRGNPPNMLNPTGVDLVGYQSIVANGPLPPGSLAGALVPEGKWAGIQQFSLGVQHEFRGNNLLGVTYVGNLSRHLASSRNINQVPLGSTTKNVPSLANFVGTDSYDPINTTPMCDAAGNCDVQRMLINNQASTRFFGPYRGYTSIPLLDNMFVSNYNSLQVSYRHAMGHGLTFQAAYTWSHAIDTNTVGVEDTNPTRFRASASTNRTNVLTLNYVYDLPFFKNSSSAFVKGGLGGWKISGITSFFSGEPIDFNCGITGLSSGIGQSVRCNTLGPLKIKKGVTNDPQFGPMQTWFDPSALGQITLPQLQANGEAGMFGYMGRNVLTGPGRNNWDLALLKDFRLPWFSDEHSTIQFRWETYNTFNHTQWQYVNAGCNGSTPAGQPCTGSNNVGNSEVAGAWPSRVIQLGMKFIF